MKLEMNYDAVVAVILACAAALGICITICITIFELEKLKHPQPMEQTK